jgi:hypothetical protein
MGGSVRCEATGCLERRFGDKLVGEESREVESLWSLGRSVDAKFRHDGVRGGVDSPDREGNTIVLLHCSQIPDAEFMPCLQVLQIATVVEQAESTLLL